MNENIAVTGANGFIGSALAQQLSTPSREVRRLVRTASRAGEIAVGDIGPNTKWHDVLKGVDVVIHAAARVHIMNEQRVDALSAFRHVNVAGTLSLAEQGVAAGIRRLVFLSSVKVFGESTELGVPFKVGDQPKPADAYGLSKWEAEQRLQELADRTGLDVVIVRLPIVYGRGVKANFRRMVRMVASGVPIPLGSVENRRSLVSLGNLTDFLRCCIYADAASKEELLVSDGEDLSTPELIRKIAFAMGRPVRLVHVPVGLLRMSARVAGFGREIDRLVGSLQMDTSASMRLLDWSPPLSVDEGIREAVRI